MRRLAATLVSAVLGVGALAAAPPPVVAVDAGAGCPSGRVALTFDDGPSAYRPQTLRILRNHRVPATFFDVGMRVAANPHVTRFEAREGHLVLNHTYRHDDLGQLSATDVRYEVLATGRALEEAGARLPFRGVRSPFGGTSPTSRTVIADLGYVDIGADVLAADWLLSTTAETIRDTLLGGLADGAVLLMHDGAIDTPAGAAVVEALPQVLRGVRERGFCFGVTGEDGEVVARRLHPSRQSIPRIEHPVPYRPIVVEGDSAQEPPRPYVVPSGLPARYLSVELQDLRDERRVHRGLVRRLERLVDAAEAAQLRGQVAEQREQLTGFRDAVAAARTGRVDAAARARLLTLTDRLLASLEPPVAGS